MNVKNSRFWSRLMANWHQKVIALIASLFVFVFYRISTQHEIRVSLDVKRPPGFELAREWPQNITIVARGSTAPRSFSEKDFKAVADLTGYTQGGLVKAAVSVQYLREEDSDTGVEFDFSPSVIEFLLEPVLDKYIPVDVKAGVTGVLPPGYFLENLAYTPHNVLVRGPKSHVEKITQAAIEKFDLTGKKTTFTGSSRILTGSRFVRTVDASEVRITAIIKGRRKIDNIGLIYNGLRAHLTVKEVVWGTIEFEGTERALGNLKPEDLFLAVDCSDVTAPGEYTLPLQPPALPEAPQAELKITSISPAEVTLQFVRKETEDTP